MSQGSATASAAPRAWSVPVTASAPDDPLLGCLVALTRLFLRPVSPDALVAGLPLASHRLTPDLFLRAAERGGLSARIARQPFDGLGPLQLPAVLLLQEGDAVVLVGRAPDGALRLILPAAGAGETTMPAAELAARYTGYAIHVQPAFRFDARAADAAPEASRDWFWGVVLKSWPLYAEALVASLLINLFALATPLFTMNVYDRVVPNRAIETLWALAIGVGIVLAFDLLMRSLRGWFVDAAGKRIDVSLSASIFERVMGIQMAARPASVGSFASGLQEFESFREFLTSITVTALVDLPFVLVFIGAMFWIGGPLGWVCVAAVPLVLGFTFILQRPIARTVQATMRLSAQRQATLIETLVGLETIKVMGAQGSVQRRWEQTVTEIARLGMRSRLLSGLAVNVSTFAQQAAYIAVVVAGVYLISEDRLTTGGLIACTILTGRALSPLTQIASLLTRWHQSRAALASADRLMKLPTERPAAKDFVHRPRLSGAIEFRDVRFRYPGQSQDALAGVSFTVRPGERVGLIGRVGSGKTTIEKLVLGLYPPASGSVLIDGAEVRQLDPAALRRDVGHVPQDIVLFYGSVRDNIVMGAPWVDDAAMLRAARVAGVADFVEKMPDGYDLQVGERGELLSGGQRQAIAIARAELTAPPVLLLDEPTSAMDNRSEEQFKARMARATAGRTLLLVTHRASLLALVDRLIVMDQGRIVADGPKEQVLAALAGEKPNARAD